MSVDPRLIGAWLAARSVARGLPAPVAEEGGWRVESGLPDERRRYVFIEPCARLRMLGAEIDEPQVAIKLCRSNEELLALLPPRWGLTWDTDSKVMVRTAPPPPGETRLPDGYHATVDRDGAVTFVVIRVGGEIAASGYAAEHAGVFIYDRIRTQQAHQRRGLGRALMTMLGAVRQSADAQEILTATPAGRGLYESMGWRVYSPWSTAMIPAAE